MLKCNTEIMKDLKKIQEERMEILSNERKNSTISYIAGEEKISTNYNYRETRDKIDELNKKEVYLRGLLSKANSTVIVPEFNMTIGDCLVYLAQLSNKANVLYSLADAKPKSRSYRLKEVEYTETVYDVNEAKEDYEKTKDEITRLQMAIDRINLTNLIEV